MTRLLLAVIQQEDIFLCLFSLICSILVPVTQEPT